MPVAILTVFDDDDEQNVLDTAIVLEGAAIVLQDIPDIATAFAYLFGLLYAINIDYPKKMMYTFEAIQTIFFSARLQILTAHKVSQVKTSGLITIQHVQSAKNTEMQYLNLLNLFV